MTKCGAGDALPLPFRFEERNPNTLLLTITRPDGELEMNRTVPFLLQFGESIPRQELPPVYYDASRQVSRALVDGQWRDVVDCAGAVNGDATKKTGVGHETTDDE